MSADYHVQIRIKNGRIIKAMREAGIESVAELARRSGAGYQSVIDLLAMRIKPLRYDGSWRAVAVLISGALGVMPDDLFNEQQKATVVENNTFEAFTDVGGIARLSGTSDVDAIDAKETVNKLMLKLNPREERVCRLIMDGATLEEAGQDIGVTRERLRQIHFKAIRKMRHAYSPALARSFGYSR